jgi:hypothetical protein
MLPDDPSNEMLAEIARPHIGTDWVCLTALLNGEERTMLARLHAVKPRNRRATDLLKAAERAGFRASKQHVAGIAVVF